MYNFGVGSIVKINPAIFGASPTETDLYGKLGYVGIFRHLTFKVDRLENDPNRGAGALLSIVNPDVLVGVAGTKRVKYEGLLFVLIEDMVPANIKLTLDYTIKVDKIDNNQILANLMKARREMKALGRKMGDLDMRSNWRSIELVRKEIQAGRIVYNSGDAIVTVKGGRYKFTVPSAQLPVEGNEDSLKKFQGYITNLIRQQRAKDSKLTYTERVVLGERLVQLGGVYTEGGQPVKAYEKSLLTTLRADKIPRNASANYVGVEIEFVHSGKIPKMEELFIKQRLHKNVQLTTDGSVHACHNAPRGYQGAELRILGTENNIEEVLRKTCSVLTCGAIDGYVNRSCGLHVHLDMRKRDANLVYQNLVRVMNLLTRSQPVGRTLTHFCVPNKYEDMNQRQEGLQAAKYLVVNPLPYLGGRNTIEVRVHEGSVDAAAINNWVQFLNAIANHDILLTKKDYTSAKQLAKIINIPENSVSYIDQRIDKFYTDAV